jgi:hypothetical protein
MTNTELEKTFNGVAIFVEVAGGMRKQLISDGFSPPIAELIVLEAIKGLK